MFPHKFLGVYNRYIIISPQVIPLKISGNLSWSCPVSPSERFFKLLQELFKKFRMKFCHGNFSVNFSNSSGFSSKQPIMSFSVYTYKCISWNYSSCSKDSFENFFKGLPRFSMGNSYRIFTHNLSRRFTRKPFYSFYYNSLRSFNEISFKTLVTFLWPCSLVEVSRTTVKPNTLYFRFMMAPRTFSSLFYYNVLLWKFLRGFLQNFLKDSFRRFLNNPSGIFSRFFCDLQFVWVIRTSSTTCQPRG